jgi:hypothetical protein
VFPKLESRGSDASLGTVDARWEPVVARRRYRAVLSRAGRRTQFPALRVRAFGLAVGSTVTLCRAGIQHRVGMTGNQPGHDLSLPRPALAAKRAACLHHRTYVLFSSSAVRGESQITLRLSSMENSRAPLMSEILHCIQNDRRGGDANLPEIPRARPSRSGPSDKGPPSPILTTATFQKLDLMPWLQVSATS